jgi:hypothetical protein
MFTITYVAGDYLTELLDTANASEETAVRFVVENNTLTPKLDTARPGDAAFDHEGRTVLVLDSSVAQAMADSTLDVQATDEGPQLVLLR